MDPMKVEKALKNQELICQEITALVNKDPLSSEIDEKWAQFEENHSVLKKLPEIVNHPYMMENYREKLRGSITNSREKNKPIQAEATTSTLNTTGLWQLGNEIDAFLDNEVAMALESNVVSNMKKILHRLQRMPETFAMKVELLDKKLKTSRYYDNQINKINDAIVDMQDSMDAASNADKIVNEQPLPKMELPKFYGDQGKWSIFSDLFKELVHNRIDLSVTKKFQYLKLSICGDALKTVTHLMDGSSSNYQHTWELLESRYENNRKIFSENVEKLICLPKLKEEEKPLKEFIDTVNEAIHIIKKKGDCGDDADTIIAQLILMKFDRSTMNQYDQLAENPKDVQQLIAVMDFLERLYVTVSATASTSSKSATTSSSNKTPFYNNMKIPEKDLRCGYCNYTGHDILVCRKFKYLTVEKREEYVKKNKLCSRCLLHDNMKHCAKNWTCSRCSGQNHHALIHVEKPKEKVKFSKERVSTNMVAGKESQNNTLLATAIIKVKNADGHEEHLRAMIDSGSQQTLISEEAAQLLRLPRIKEKTELSGLSSTIVAESENKIKICISSNVSKWFKTTAVALVVPTLHKSLPNKPIQEIKDTWKDDLKLADPTFDKPSRIDAIIGLDIYPKIMKPGIRKYKSLMAQNTALGWIISGGIHQTIKCPVTAVTTIELSDLNRFWELEEPEAEISMEANACEEVFKKTTTIAKDGRYIVQIPFKGDIALGSSKRQAMARFISLEKRFALNPELKKKYSEFMTEYIKLGHMKKVKSSSDGYFLPHQAVIRESSLTTKLRVVFDASAKTTNGRSLNDVMMVGPRQQKDIFDIIAKWRQWKFVISADIEKMYRQIWIAKEHQKYQKILWRDDSNKTIQQYMLTTITYGTASAPFLATRVLVDIAERVEKVSPKVYTAIREDFYMDDLLTGASTIKECQILQIDVSKELNKFGLNLRKWVANDKRIISNLNNNEDNMVIQIKENEAVKTLGLQWDPQRDVFFFKLNISEHKETTKRTVLSTLAKIFDPLGWLSPVIITGKLFMQKLWLSSLNWDTKLPEEYEKEWMQYIGYLQQLEKINIPRWIGTTQIKNAQLHGFCDASDSAYAAVIYVKIDSTVTLLASKTRANPLKNRKTIPKLELCGAHLLAAFLSKVSSILKWNGSIYAWCDSQITLAWIENDRSKEKFVRSRVGDIKKHSNISWHYIKSADNPADAASRGIQPNKLINSLLWWNGPDWLKFSKEEWPTEKTPEISIIVAASILDSSILNEIVTKYSSFGKAQRVMAYVLRFISKLQKKSTETQKYVTSDEINAATKQLIRWQQSQDFGNEINNLKRGRGLDTKNKLLSLNPFLDNDEILRVGGRLQNSPLNYNKKHPIILKKCRLVDLIISYTHTVTLHGGINIMAANIRRLYWIIGLRNILKYYVRKCVTCIRYKQEAASQIMGNLPESRVSEVHPFINTGVDYAGPINIRCSPGRGRKTYKGYVAVFVCMSTRCIHLEVVSDLTSEAFMASLKRFFSRRGKSSNIFSDNGTNFVGATKLLEDDLQKAINENNKLAPTLEAEGVKWHFIPPAAPHFGGIWEAGVKSFKHHLKRVIGEATLTYEEMSTLLCQIEAVLNSRPLYATGDDVEDIDVLTPGHFLIGRPLLSSPEAMKEERLGALDRWRLIQKMQRDFWKRWKDEYLSSLQQRNKWKLLSENIKKDQIVILKNENTPPAKWPMGIVANSNAGKDGRVRVVEIKTQAGLVKRPITKVCPLNCESEKMPDSDSLGDIRISTRNSRSQNSTTTTSLMLITLLHICMVFTALANGIATVEEIKKSTIIYVDPITQINIASSTWNMVVYYEMGSYFDVLTKSTHLLQKSKEICPRLGTFEDQCWAVLNNMQYKIEKINTNNLLLLNKEARIKRDAPLKFMGSFYHIIMGLMDDDDRQAFEQNMKNILANQHDLKDLAKKQTSVVDSTVNLLKRTTESVNANFKDMKSSLENISATVNENYFVYRESVRFFMVTKQMHDLIDECNEVQKEAIDLLLDINHGKVHPALISPQQLQAEIVKIRDALPDKYVLPGRHTNTELKEIWHLLTGKGIFVETQLIIDLQIPLFNRQTSQFFKVIPVPFKKDGHVLVAKIKAPYLVYSYELDSFHFLSQAILNECKNTLSNQLVCKENFPWMSSTTNFCELSPIKPLSTLNCSYEEADEMPFWVELRNKGNWLFKIFKNTAAHVKCSNQKQLILPLPHQGIFSLERDCTARIDEITLVATHDVSSKLNSNFHSILTKDIDLDQGDIIKPLGNVIINNSLEIAELQKHISDLKKENIQLRGLSFHHLSGHAALGISTIVVIIIIAYCSCQLAIRRRLVTVQLKGPRQNVQN